MTKEDAVNRCRQKGGSMERMITKSVACLLAASLLVARMKCLSEPPPTSYGRTLS
jgi:hypothetical protein